VDDTIATPATKSAVTAKIFFVVKEFLKYYVIHFYLNSTMKWEIFVLNRKVILLKMTPSFSRDKGVRVPVPAVIMDWIMNPIFSKRQLWVYPMD